MIYFIECRSMSSIKVGYAKTVRRCFSRLMGHQIGCPADLTMLEIHDGDLRTESRLHKKFRHLRRRGEWFWDHHEIRGYIASEPGYFDRRELKAFVRRSQADADRRRVLRLARLEKAAARQEAVVVKHLQEEQRLSREQAAAQVTEMKKLARQQRQERELQQSVMGKHLDKYQEAFSQVAAIVEATGVTMTLAEKQAMARQVAAQMLDSVQ